MKYTLTLNNPPICVLGILLLRRGYGSATKALLVEIGRLFRHSNLLIFLKDHICPLYFKNMSKFQ